MKWLALPQRLFFLKHHEGTFSCDEKSWHFRGCFLAHSFRFWYHFPSAGIHPHLHPCAPVLWLLKYFCSGYVHATKAKVQSTSWMQTSEMCFFTFSWILFFSLTFYILLLQILKGISQGSLQHNLKKQSVQSVIRQQEQPNVLLPLSRCLSVTHQEVKKTVYSMEDNKVLYSRIIHACISLNYCSWHPSKAVGKN